MSLAHQIKPAGAPVSAQVKRQIVSVLPAMVKAAADKLASASVAAEVLDAKDAAALTYDAAKRAARLAKAKQAHDDLIAAAHRAQADALDIESAAKRRLADEYDGGQARGEIATRGRPENVPDRNNKPTATEVGLSRKDVHDARRVRDAEIAQPGVVRQALDEALDQGKEPTRAVVNAAVAGALGEAKPVDTRSDEERDLVALQAAWDRAGEGARKRFLEINHIGGNVPRADRAGADARLAAPARPFESQAKASEDNDSITGGAGAVTGEVSRQRRRRRDGGERPAPLSKAEQARILRPHCQNADNLEKCGGSGRKHCTSCARAAGIEEAA